MEAFSPKTERVAANAKCVSVFTLVELLVVIAIIALLAGMLLPVLSRAKQKAHESECMNNLKQIGATLIMYRDESEDQMPPWLSRLYPHPLETTAVYHCPRDKEVDASPAKTPAQWDPHPYDGDQYAQAYDRTGNTGLNVDPNPDVEKISYFYEFSDAACGWTLPGFTLPGPFSWSQLKHYQLDNNNGDPYDPTIFPVVRCFWHIRFGNGNMRAPVMNIAYAGNYLLTRLQWEDGQWSP